MSPPTDRSLAHRSLGSRVRQNPKESPGRRFLGSIRLRARCQRSRQDLLSRSHGGFDAASDVFHRPGARLMSEQLNSSLVDVLSVTLRVPADRISDEFSPAECANWDSVRHLMLMLAIEDRFEISF